MISKCCSKLAVENCDLTHHAEEAERTSAQLSKDKTSLSTQLEDARRLADAETRVSAHAHKYSSYLLLPCLQSV